MAGMLFIVLELAGLLVLGYSQLSGPGLGPSSSAQSPQIISATPAEANHPNKQKIVCEAPLTCGVADSPVSFDQENKQTERHSPNHQSGSASRPVTGQFEDTTQQAGNPLTSERD